MGCCELQEGAKKYSSKKIKTGNGLKAKAKKVS